MAYVGLNKWTMTAEIGGNPVRRHHVQFEQLWKTNMLTRDGVVEPVSRDQIFRRERGQGTVTTSTIGNLTRLIYTLLNVMTLHG